IINNSYLTIVTPSKWLFEKAKKGIFKNKDIKLIYNGVNENVFKVYNKATIRKELNLPVDKTLFLFSGAWGLNKGGKDSSETMQLLFERYKNRKDVVLCIL